MELLILLLNIAGATMLLLFAVRTVQGGVDALAGAKVRRNFSGKNSRLRSTATGVILAIVLQSSAAVTLLTVGFYGSGSIGFTAGLATVLGADFGSALVVQLLSFRPHWLPPMLLAIGGWLYLKNSGDTARNAGRILLGIGLILVSLRFMSESFSPIRESELFPTVTNYLDRDYLTAFLFGTFLALVMHSSVAVILMCVTMAEIGALPTEVGAAIVLGANLGSSLIPVWLTRGLSPTERQIPIANLVIRGTFACFVFFTAHRYTNSLVEIAGGGGQLLIIVHLIFNALVLVVTPFAGAIERACERLLPKPKEDDTPEASWIEATCLNHGALSSPSLALANMRREVLRMAQIVGEMARPSLAQYREGDAAKINRIEEMDWLLNDALSEMRRFGAELPFDRMSKKDRRLAGDFTEIAVDLEAAGDIISKQMMRYAKKVQKQKVTFSKDGWSELEELNALVLENMEMAFGVLTADDTDMAKLVVEGKALVRQLESNSRKSHLKRLRRGDPISFESSDMHLETLRALREFNSKIASLSYPILLRHKMLLDHRLAV
ncbi:Na/Pi cotransporter family protein [Pseudophaeobacter sp.]|uniref:Na/Pi cotransporter family protein n=1 Tax=Pseudophaeobacter sp. TaxID=1971739 RepID=UPI0032971A09